MKKRRFHLEKLYLDCIDHEGNCFIIYWAELKLFLVDLVYTSVIFSGGDGSNAVKSSLRRVPCPAEGDVISFAFPHLHLAGRWKRNCDPVSDVLYTSPDGEEVSWTCHQPRSKAEVTFMNRSCIGSGYAEKIILAVPPWKLPIDELRWGRFLSPNHAVVWIQWKGSYPVNKLFYNGEVFHDAVFSENTVAFREGTCIVQFGAISVVREGRLARLLSGMPWLKFLFPKRILNTVEAKYKSFSRFVTSEGSAEEGWALFEKVLWDR